MPKRFHISCSTTWILSEEFWGELSLFSCISVSINNRTSRMNWNWHEVLHCRQCYIAGSVILQAVWYCSQCCIAVSVVLQSVWYCSQWASAASTARKLVRGLILGKMALHSYDAWYQCSFSMHLHQMQFPPRNILPALAPVQSRTVELASIFMEEGRSPAQHSKQLGLDWLCGKRFPDLICFISHHIACKCIEKGFSLDVRLTNWRSYIFV